MTWPSSEPSPARLAALRDAAAERGEEHAALLFQLHLLAQEDSPEERERLLDLLPEAVRELDEAPAYTGILLRLFVWDQEPWDEAFFSFKTSTLMEIAFLLRAEAEQFSPDGAEILASRITLTLWDIYGQSSYVPELFLLYEIVHMYRGEPREQTLSLYRDILKDCLDMLVQIDAASVSDLLLIVGTLLETDAECRAEALDLVQLCVDIRLEFFGEDTPFLMVARSELMHLYYLMGDSAAALEQSRILLSQPEADFSRAILCHTHLLIVDILLDRMENAGVDEHLRQAEALLEALPQEDDEDDRLRFQLHTAWARRYFYSTESPSDLSRMEFHAKQAYLLSRTHEYSGEESLAAINNLLYPLAYSSQDEEALRLLLEGAALIEEGELYRSRAAAILYITASFFGLEEILPPETAQAVQALSTADNDVVLHFWFLFNSAYTQLQEGLLSQNQLGRIHTTLDRCEALLDRLYPGVTTASVALKRAKALLFLRQGARTTARKWALSALEDARTHQNLYPQGMLFSTAIPLLPYLPDLLDRPALTALLEELAGGMEDRIRRILNCRDEEYILKSLWSNTIIINFTLALADQGLITIGVNQLYELIINGKSIYSRLLRINRRRREAHPEDEPLYRQIDRLRADIMDEKVEELLRGTVRDISVAEEEKRLLEISLSEDPPEDFRWISCGEILRNLPPAAVLVDYYAYPANRSGDLVLGDMRYAVFVLFRADGYLRLRQLTSLNFLEVRRNLLFVTAGARATKNKTLARAVGAAGYLSLYQLLFRPVESLVGPEVRTLFFSPDGDLPKLPFSLLSRDSSTFLCDRYSVVYLESARDLKPDQNIRPVGRETLVIGNPDFSLTPLAPSQVPPVMAGRLVQKVPFTKLEAQMVAEKTGAVPLMRRAADKHALQDCHASIVHIATHGAFFSDQEDDSEEYEYAPNPMRRSCLYFAGANDWLLTGEKDPVLGNGILTAEELCNYRMDPPDLVVLSACFSGMGDIRQGNGIVGLQTAFKVQGARVMLLSIWEADDFASLILMDRFYDNLSSMPAGQALRDAQHYLRTVTIGELGCAGWFDERRFRRIGLVAEDMRKMSRLKPTHRPFAQIRYWGGYILYE